MAWGLWEFLYENFVRVFQLYLATWQWVLWYSTPGRAGTGPPLPTSASSLSPRWGWGWWRKLCTVKVIKTNYMHSLRLAPPCDVVSIFGMKWQQKTMNWGWIWRHGAQQEFSWLWGKPVWETAGRISERGRSKKFNNPICSQMLVCVTYCAMGLALLAMCMSLIQVISVSLCFFYWTFACQ